MRGKRTIIFSLEELRKIIVSVDDKRIKIEEKCFNPKMKDEYNLLLGTLIKEYIGK